MWVLPIILSDEAIKREKIIKKWRRGIKYDAIEKMNPRWEDLYDSIAA